MIRTSILLQYIASNFVMIQQFTDNGQPGESRLIWKLQVRKMQIDSSRTIDWTLNNTPILQQSSMKYFLDRNLLFTGSQATSPGQRLGICIGEMKAHALPWLAAISVSFAKYFSGDTMLK